MVKHNLISQIFLELPEQASGESWVLFEMCGVESPLMLEGRSQVLCKGGGESLGAKPLGKGILESEEVSGFAGVECAVHIGCEENAKMRWQCQLFKGEDVVVVVSGCVWIKEESTKM